MPPTPEITVRVADAPAVVALFEQAERAIEVKNAALAAWLESEHPDEGCRLACPDVRCVQARVALAYDGSRD